MVKEVNQELEADAYEKHEFKADPGQEPLRIDKFLLHRLERISRNKIQNAAKAACILVNEQPVKSNYKVKPKDTISIILPTSEHSGEVEPEDIPINVVYEDKDLLVVDKEAGMVVHPGVGNYTGTLINAVLFHVQKEDPAIVPGLAHRIDKNTSGLLVLSKNEYVMTHLAKQFYDHTVNRKYIALVWGDVENDEGTIEGNIARDQRHRKLYTVYPDGDHGKEAITHYKVVERFGYTTLVECQLETGRTHQIRVHMKHIGHTLFADNFYGGDKILKGTVYTKYKQFVQNCFKLISRQALHAQTLGFIHPETGKELEFHSPLPDDFEKVIQKWRSYRKAD